MNGADWNALVRSRRDQILACSDPEAFEKEVNRLVAELKTSHTGFRHAGMRNIPARHAINATLHRLAMNGTERWMFQDVHPGGPAYLAGIRPGDLVLGAGEREIRPPEELNFSAGESAQLTVQKLDGGVQGVTLQLPMPKSKKHPVTAPEAVHAEMLGDERDYDFCHGDDEIVRLTTKSPCFDKLGQAYLREICPTATLGAAVELPAPNPCNGSLRRDCLRLRLCSCVVNSG